MLVFKAECVNDVKPFTSFDPNVLAELCRHAHKKSLTLRSNSLVQIVTRATYNLLISQANEKNHSVTFIVHTVYQHKHYCSNTHNKTGRVTVWVVLSPSRSADSLWV